MIVKRTLAILGLVTILMFSGQAWAFRAVLIPQSDYDEVVSYSACDPSHAPVAISDSVGDFPEDVAIDSVARKFFVAATDGLREFQIGLDSPSLVHTYTVGVSGRANMVAVDEKRHWVFAVNDPDGLLGAFDTQTHIQVGTYEDLDAINVDNVHFFTYDPERSRLYILHQDTPSGDNLTVYEVTDADPFANPSQYDLEYSGGDPYEIIIDQDHERAFVNHFGNNYLTVHDLNSLSQPPLDNIRFGNYESSSGRMAYDPYDGRLYVLNTEEITQDGSLTVFNTKVTPLLEVSDHTLSGLSFPLAIAVDARLKKLYITDLIDRLVYYYNAPGVIPQVMVPVDSYDSGAGFPVRIAVDDADCDLRVSGLFPGDNTTIDFPDSGSLNFRIDLAGLGGVVWPQKLLKLFWIQQIRSRSPRAEIRINEDGSGSIEFDPKMYSDGADNNSSHQMKVDIVGAWPYSEKPGGFSSQANGGGSEIGYDVTSSNPPMVTPFWAESEPGLVSGSIFYGAPTEFAGSGGQPPYAWSSFAAAIRTVIPVAD